MITGLSKILTISSSLLNVALAVMVYHAKATAPSQGISEIKPGVALPSLLGADLAGGRQSIDYPSDKETVLYVFSPSCTWCRRNERSSDRLARTLQGRARFIGVSLDRDGLFEWMTLQRPPYKILTDLSYRALLSYRFVNTPTTLLISKKGIVLRIWHGAYRDKTLEEIENYFNVVLPSASLAD